MVSAGVENSEQRRSQLLRGVLDVCLLALISEEPRYGYELAEGLAQRGLALVSEGSIYPLLSRMQSAGLVSVFKTASGNGPPRKYYQLTDAGAAELAAGRRSWAAFAESVGQVLAVPTRPEPSPSVPSRHQEDS
ncbi:PadR family transcriptional regulator [Micromonospora sp. NPDC048839]|uniref:PadR family transcriptional regulator n=1 Tax=Micromonospora sp. NPDC048839 TaxID=3155641 RepID=UPI0033C74698